MRIVVVIREGGGGCTEVEGRAVSVASDGIFNSLLRSSSILTSLHHSGFLAPSLFRYPDPPKLLLVKVNDVRLRLLCVVKDNVYPCFRIQVLSGCRSGFHENVGIVG